MGVFSAFLFILQDRHHQVRDLRHRLGFLRLRHPADGGGLLHERSHQRSVRRLQDHHLRTLRQRLGTTHISVYILIIDIRKSNAVYVLNHKLKITLLILRQRLLLYWLLNNYCHIEPDAARCFQQHIQKNTRYYVKYYGLLQSHQSILYVGNERVSLISQRNIL